MNRNHLVENNTVRHSVEIQEIISSVPPGLIWRGMMLFTTVIMAIVFTAFYIHYPDIINAPLAIKQVTKIDPVINRKKESGTSLGSLKIFSNIYIKQDISWKVRIGQTIIIKLDSSSVDLYGTIKSITGNFDSNRRFVATAEIDLCIKSKTYVKNVMPGEFGNAKILTKDISIFKRIIKRF